MKVAVLGAGLAGLSSAYELSKQGTEVVVFEICPEVGGLAKSFKRDGFIYDLGPHRFHSKNKETINHLKEVMDGNLIIRKRLSHIYLQGKLFIYPLEVKNVLRNMPISVTFLIMKDYALAKINNIFRKKRDKSFEDWVESRFGRKLYDIYFKPYTEKSWGLRCKEISPDWAAQRITLLNLGDAIIKTIFKPKNVPRTLVPKFYYPKEGGIGRISENYSDYIKKKGNKVLINTSIKKISIAENRINSITYEHDGKMSTEKFDYTLSTIPINKLVNLIEPRPKRNVLDAVSNLKFRSIIFVYLIINKDRLSDNHWIYLPERGFLSNRVSEFKNFNPLNGKPGKTIICGEITCNYNDKLWNMADSELMKGFIRDIERVGLAEKGDVIASFAHRMEHAYPLYTLDYKDVLSTAFDHLNKIDNLEYYGRNALFRYNNMDQSIEMGIKAAKYLFDKKSRYGDIATEQRWFG